MKKQRIHVLTIVLIVAIVLAMIAALFVVHRVWGYVPILGAKIADSKLQNYTGTASLYTRYDFHNGIYTVVDGSDISYHYNLKHDTLFDGLLNEEVNTSANAVWRDFVAYQPESIICPDSVYLWTEVDASNFATKYQKIYLGIVYCEEAISEDQIAKWCEDAIQYLDADNSITSCQVWFATKEAFYEVIIPFSKDVINTDKIKEHLEKQVNLPLDYIVWRDRNKH
ncbi:hypothetical protein CE91St46_31670 [Eubacteriales bacterium]|nr:hypothetical protein [Faecalicatena sp. BF-R-105]GKH52056.1 hypothetical protein CE91St46_31670 [Eubacteriales bacterium]GKH64776.1 hypothetical protein CE91St47_32450 [Eubacteriales bacterium]